MSEKELREALLKAHEYVTEHIANAPGYPKSRAILAVIDAALSGDTDHTKCFECNTPLQMPICPKCNPEFDIAALSPSPERQTMTDEEAKTIYHEELAKLDMGVSNRAGKAAIAAIKRASSGERK